MDATFFHDTIDIYSGAIDTWTYCRSVCIPEAFMILQAKVRLDDRWGRRKNEIRSNQHFPAGVFAQKATSLFVRASAPYPAYTNGPNWILTPSNFYKNFSERPIRGIGWYFLVSVAVSVVRPILQKSKWEITTNWILMASNFYTAQI